MSMSDPVADMLTRIRNAQMVGHTEVRMPSSRLKVAIANVLKDEGYIDECAVRDNSGKADAPAISCGLAPLFSSSRIRLVSSNPTAAAERSRIASLRLVD